MEDSRNIIKAIDALTQKAGGGVVDSKNITEAIDNLKAVYDQKAIGIDKTLTQEGVAADAKAVGDAIGELSNVKTFTDSATLSTTKYGDFYYGEIDPPVNINKIISIVVFSSTGNNFAYAQITGVKIRVYGSVSGATVSVRCSYV